MLLRNIPGGGAEGEANETHTPPLSPLLNSLSLLSPLPRLPSLFSLTRPLSSLFTSITFVPKYFTAAQLQDKDSGVLFIAFLTPPTHPLVHPPTHVFFIPLLPPTHPSFLPICLHTYYFHLSTPQRKVNGGKTAVVSP